MEDEIIYGSGIYREVIEVKPREDYTLFLTFEDGSKRIYDCKPLLNRKINEKLNDINFFMQARVDCCGGVEWFDYTDIDPEDLYEESVIVE